MKKTIIFLILSSFLFIVYSCTTYEPIAFVVKRDVPKEPNVTVISNRGIVSGIVEEALIEIGVSVLSPPGQKKFEEKLSEAKASGKAEENSEDSKGSIEGEISSGERVVIESYYGLDFNSDYVVFVDEYNKRIKVEKVDTKELLSTFKYKFEPEEESLVDDSEMETFKFKYSIYNLVTSLGLSLDPYYMPFDLAKRYLEESSVEFDTFNSWQDYVKSGNKPNYIPSSPNEVYKNRGWTNWDDWLPGEQEKEVTSE
jgi:hypothetical protein